LYSLNGLFGRRGFYLSRGNNRVFETAHKWGMLPSSYTRIADQEFQIKPTNFVGDKFQVIKNGVRIGRLDFSNYRYSKIVLSRIDEMEDVFRLDEIGYSQTFILHKNKIPHARFTMSLNPARIDKKYTIDILSEEFSDDILHELLFYTGEILYRMIKPDQGSFRGI